MKKSDANLIILRTKQSLVFAEKPFVAMGQLSKWHDTGLLEDGKAIEIRNQATFNESKQVAAPAEPHFQPKRRAEAQSATFKLVKVRRDSAADLPDQGH